MPFIVGVMEGKKKSDRMVAKVGIKAVCEFAIELFGPNGITSVQKWSAMCQERP